MKVAIIDDDQEAIQIAEVEVIEAGFTPLIIPGPIESCHGLAISLSSKADGVLCDHRLGYSGFASFMGAELVANLFDLKIPAILVTQYTDIDKDVSIRKWRHKIPVLLSRDETSAQRIKDGLTECKNELGGMVRQDRKPYRTLIRIETIGNESGESVIDAVIPSWNPHRAVRFPLSLLNEEIRQQVKPLTRLIASVNIGADRSEDLFFDRFEIAREIEIDGH
jgi:hypothetical protein